jgi:PAS domain S-box-containing protein
MRLEQNHPVERVLGYTAEEFLLMKWIDLYPDSHIREVESIFSAISTGQSEMNPFPLAAKHGALIPVNTRIWSGIWNEQNCIFGLIHDLREEIETQQRFERLFRHNPSPMALTNISDHRFFDINEAFVETVGYPREEVIGRTTKELGLLVNVQKHEAIRKRLMKEGRFTGTELQVRCKDGRIIEGLFSGDIITSHGQVYSLTVMVDITARKQTEKALKQTLALQRLLADISAAGIEPVKLHQYLNESLALMGQVLDVSRSYIFEIDHETSVMNNTFEWCMDGVSHRKDNLQNLPMDWFKWWTDILTQQEIIARTKFEDFLDHTVRDVFQLQNVRSLLAVPILMSEQFHGFIAFDDSLRERTWADEHVELLKAMARVISGVIQRTHREKLLHRTTARKQRQAEIVAGFAVSSWVANGNLQELAAWLTEFVSTAFHIGRVGVWFFDESRTRLINEDNYDAASGCHSTGDILTEHEFRNEFAFLKRDKYVDGNDPLTDPRLAGYVEGYIKPNGITAMLNAVIRLGGDALGTICFEHVDKPHRWEEDEIIFACQLGDQVAIAISNAKRRKAEADLRESNSQLEKAIANAGRMAREAQAANIAKSEFLANMSHELRTPLNAILALSEALIEEVRGPLNDRQKSSLQNIDTSGRHLLDLINDVLDLAKVESGYLEIALQWLPISEVCEACLTFVREMAGAKNLALTFHSDNLISHIHADPKRLRQMLVNLLSNAVKFTPSGGRVNLAVTTVADREAVCFSVEDTGIGIAPEDLNRLFKPFTQLDSSLSRKHEGTGLGLVLVRHLVEMHGGSISVESEPEKGSRFSIVLPARKTESQIPESTPFSFDQNPATPLRKKHPLNQPAKSDQPVTSILLAEDNEANIDAVGEYLRDMGFRVTVARDGMEALALAKNTLPDIILMDIQMPKMDGLEATRQLRQVPACQNTPVIALTALAMPGDRKRCLDAGADDYLVKPVGMKNLVANIHRLLEGTSVYHGQ